ncbi:MAG: hypothetical protein WBI82_09825 [Sphaerochaeta sp.]
MPPFPPQGAGYLTLLSQHSLGNGTMVMLPLLSLRWGMNQCLSPWVRSPSPYAGLIVPQECRQCRIWESGYEKKPAIPCSSTPGSMLFL